MKRLFSLFLIGMLTLSLSACTGNPQEPSAESPNVSDETNSAGASEAANHIDHTKSTQWSSNTAISPLKKVKNPGKISFDDYSRQSDRRAANTIDEPFLQAVNSFAGVLSVQMLCGQGENLNFSPVSLYMALSLAASGAKGATQEELLAALGLSGKSMDYLATQSSHLFQRLYRDNEVGQLHVANSIWLRQDSDFRAAFVDQAAEKFYASAYRVDFTNPKTAQAMSKWISEQTNGVLKPDVSFQGNQLLTLLNTIYFKDEWMDRFERRQTKPDAFYVSAQQTVQCDYMNRTYAMHPYTRGGGFTRSALSLKNGGRMVFILPDQGVSIDTLLASPQKAASLFLGVDQGAGKVVFQIPKFSFGSKLNLKKTLHAMGVRCAFESDQADFSGMTQDQAFFSQILQETHIAIDEKGVEAAAFTKLDYAGTAAPNEKEAYMILNRPFLYGIVSDGVLLFAGVCNRPAES